MKTVLIICVFIKALIFVNGAKILAVQLVPTKSFANIMSSVIETLAPQHEITYCTITDEEFDHLNITVINIPKRERTYSSTEQENVFEKNLEQEVSSTDAANMYMSLTPEYIEHYFNTDIFQELLHLKPKYDVLIMFYTFSEYFIPFAYHLNVPFIQIASTSPCSWQNEAIGNPNFISFDNSLFTAETPDSFFSRFKKIIKHIRILIRYNWYYLPSMNKITMKYFSVNSPTIEIISKNTSLLFVNTNEAMGYSRPSLSNYVEIGGLHCKPPKSLPRELKQFMDETDDNGVIYFSLGATFQAQMPDKVVKAFINVFRRLPQRVIWKVSADMDRLPENVMALRWCPQQDILGHNKTKVFITQGGILSLQETVYHGVPVLVIPIVLDQPNNAETVHKLGYGRHLPLNKFSEEKLFTELQEILSNPKYKIKAEEISSLMKDVQQTPAEKLVWWVSYIIRHKGFPIYRPNDDRYSWSKNVEIDIVLFIQLILLLILVIVIVLFKILNRYIVCIKNKTKIS